MLLVRVFLFFLICNCITNVSCFSKIPCYTKFSTSALNDVPAPSWDGIVANFMDSVMPGQKLFRDKLKEPNSKSAAGGKDLTIYDAEITAAKEVLREASRTKAEDPEKVLDSLVSLEKLMRSKNKLDEGETSRATLEKLNGSWRLVFTTGTVDTQKKIGKVNYFPLKAVQSFDTTSMDISNGIYAGNVELLKFFGDFEWKDAARKLEFDFDEISVLGFRFKLPKGGAAQLGKQTGLGAAENVEREKKGVKPFFNWISADDDIATARGGGGGLALWKRDEDMQQKNFAAAIAEGAKASA